MSFAVIEGLDGSGKSTQIKLLRAYLEENQVNYRYLHFPRTDAPVYGELIARFLRGDLGRISEVDPWLVALIYAGDRNDAASIINQWLDAEYFVLVDRYVISNIAFQCAKLDNAERRRELERWILELEYGYNKLPKPGINLFLDVPFEFTRMQLSGERRGDDRDYLNGATDIHEANLEFQRNVRDVYLSLEGTPGYKILKCYNEANEMYSPERIFEKIIKILFEDENSEDA